ncbi:MAG: hypothetical protein ACYTG6_14270, partial [Planctomycetota bacterium]
ATEQTGAYLLLYGGESIVGPRYVLPVAALSTHVIVARFTSLTETPTQVAEALASSPLRGVLLRGRKKIWEGNARLVACGIAESRVEIRVMALQPLGAAVRRRFRPAIAAAAAL